MDPAAGAAQLCWFNEKSNDLKSFTREVIDNNPPELRGSVISGNGFIIPTEVLTAMATECHTPIVS